MSDITWDKEIERHRRFLRLVDAFEAATRWELHRTAVALLHRLEGMGGYIDEDGQWCDETRPVKRIDDQQLGTWADNHSDF